MDLFSLLSLFLVLFHFGTPTVGPYWSLKTISLYCLKDTRNKTRYDLSLGNRDLKKLPSKGCGPGSWSGLAGVCPLSKS